MTPYISSISIYVGTNGGIAFQSTMMRKPYYLRHTSRLGTINNKLLVSSVLLLLLSIVAIMTYPTHRVLVAALTRSSGGGGGGIRARFVFAPNYNAEVRPKLVLIGGATGTGKSTFGMSVALDQGIMKCISTDSVRTILRSLTPSPEASPALHRSSYSPKTLKASFDSKNQNTDCGIYDDDPVATWKETCAVLEPSIEDLLLDSVARRQGLVLEGVGLVPSTKLIEMWQNAGGGGATGCLLTITDEAVHRQLLTKRGIINAGTGSIQHAKDEAKLHKYFDRIRQIQDEMMRLAKESGWIFIEQNVNPDPLELIAESLITREIEK
jgi:2-phosphoglycerate kinase